jgi:hypothetical protein
MFLKSFYLNMFRTSQDPLSLYHGVCVTATVWHSDGVAQWRCGTVTVWPNTNTIGVTVSRSLCDSDGVAQHQYNWCHCITVSFSAIQWRCGPTPLQVARNKHTRNQKLTAVITTVVLLTMDVVTSETCWANKLFKNIINCTFSWTRIKTFVTNMYGTTNIKFSWYYSIYTNSHVQNKPKRLVSILMSVRNWHEN